ITSENILNNDSAAHQLQSIFKHCDLFSSWSAVEHKLSCLGHIINLTIEAFISEVTQIVITEMKQVI
ncbi:hypothetical protein OBBRIDRAFT_729600, partial [Obba rivulosa]